MSRVVDYQTGAPIDGDASEALEAASEAAAPTGAVRAERDARGVWQPVAPADSGPAARTVYVEP